MNFQISAIGYEPLENADKIPMELEQYYIPGTKTISCSPPFGKLLIQLIELNTSLCLYMVFALEENVPFIISIESLFIVSTMVLKGNFHYALPLQGDLFISENHFTLFYYNKRNITLSLKKGLNVCINTYYPPKFFSSFIDLFPALAWFDERIKQNENSVISTQTSKVSPKMIDAVYRLTHAPYSPFILDFHKNIVNELLHKMLQQVSESVFAHTNSSFTDLEKIYAAKEFIDANLPYHFSITRIALHVGLNEQKLKEGFSEIFGKGLFEYLRDRIFEIAQKEIEQTRRSIKQIAFRAGYKKANNFSAAFKKKFGLSPTNWRKQFNSSKKSR